MNEFAQLPTPTIATRTLSCCRPRPLWLVSLTGCLHQLLADVQDALADRDPGRAGEEHDRPRENAPRCEHETDGDHDHALCARADADVAAQADRLGLRARIGNEKRAGDGR